MKIQASLFATGRERILRFLYIAIKVHIIFILSIPDEKFCFFVFYRIKGIDFRIREMYNMNVNLNESSGVVEIWKGQQS